jgi:hypothetical protein
MARPTRKLVDIAKMPHDTQIALGDHDLENLLNEVGTQKTMDEFTAQTKHSIKKSKREKTTFPHVLKNSQEPTCAYC